MPCWSPITLKNNGVYAVQTGKHMTVPCGICLGCLQRKRSDWSIRIAYEEKVCKSSCFISLTYDDFEVPVTDNGNLTLKKSDVQKYFKRVRIKEKDPENKILYFLCAEYGSHTLRPHYHAAVFNADIEDLYTSWNLGNVKFGEVNPASIHYLTKYIVNEDTYIDYLDTLRPFRLMSKGLGKGLSDELSNYCRRASTNVITVNGGRKAVLPRYVDARIFSKAEKWIIAEKEISRIASCPNEKNYVRLFEHREYLKLLARKTSKSLKC